MNKNRYLFGLKPYGTVAMGLSLASAWAWGVSIIVGTQVIQEKGLTAFLIWAAANALALTLFGWVAGKISIRETIADAMPGVLRPLYRYFTLLIQFFSVLVNITAIMTACSMLGLPAYAGYAFTFILFMVVLLKGFDANVRGDIFFILVWMVVLAGVVAIMPKDIPVVVVSEGKDILWAAWGAVILLCGPVVDQQHWQRRASMRDKFSMNPFLLGSAIFAVYMALIGLLGIYGANCPVAVAVIILCVAGSTLLSALSALSCYGRTVRASRWIMAGCYTIASACLVLNLSVLTIWQVYGSLRIIPALYIFWLALKGKGKGDRNECV
ncbi:MAG: hypothetical protein M0P69_13040 [Bacteroidales bacterium]|nr:hypothetical protein [Bacteroidales bacterium]